MDRYNSVIKKVRHLAIGLGPSNMSLAALSDNIKDIELHIIEKKSSFNWYNGLLMDASKMQSSYIRDLVTLIDPTNKFSFINYLHTEKRLYNFLAAGFEEVPRYEFDGYFKWVSDQLNNITFDCCVNEIHYKDNVFIVYTSQGIIHAENIIMGVGNVPYFPSHALPHVEKNVLHGLSYSKKSKNDFKDKRVVIIGGGQTGAEIFEDISNDTENAPNELTWVSRRPSFNPMEESPFMTEVFTPEFSEYYHGLDNDRKGAILEQQCLASDGVSHSTLSSVYQGLYTQRYYQKSALTPNLLVSTDVTSLENNSEDYTLLLENKMSDEIFSINADIIIYCTGLEFISPNFLYPIEKMFKQYKSNYMVSSDFSLELNKEINNKIFVQNAATHSWGVSDRNLVLGAWRSAKIINSILSADHYDLNYDSTFINWKGNK